MQSRDAIGELQHPRLWEFCSSSVQMVMNPRPLKGQILLTAPSTGCETSPAAVPDRTRSLSISVERLVY